MELRVRSDQQISEYIPSRGVPLNHLLVTATTSGTAQTLYTVRAEVNLKVMALTVVNTTGAAATLTVHSIPSGGGIGAGNTEISAMSIAANTAVDLTKLVMGYYAPGTTIKVYSGTNGSLVVHGWAEEIL